jgi:hypothetical protein
MKSIIDHLVLTVTATDSHGGSARYMGIDYFFKGYNGRLIVAGRNEPEFLRDRVANLPQVGQAIVAFTIGGTDLGIWGFYEQYIQARRGITDLHNTVVQCPKSPEAVDLDIAVFNVVRRLSAAAFRAARERNHFSPRRNLIPAA